MAKIAVADWLDGKAPDGATVKTSEAAAEPPKKKRGRPRKALTAVLFHHALIGEITSWLLRDAIREAVPILRASIPSEDKEGGDALAGLSDTVAALAAAEEERALADAFDGSPMALSGPPPIF